MIYTYLGVQVGIHMCVCSYFTEELTTVNYLVINIPDQFKFSVKLSCSL